MSQSQSLIEEARQSLVVSGGSANSGEEVMDTIFGTHGWYQIVHVIGAEAGKEFVIRFQEFSELIRHDLETRHQG